MARHDQNDGVGEHGTRLIAGAAASAAFALIGAILWFSKIALNSSFGWSLTYIDIILGTTGLILALYIVGYLTTDGVTIFRMRVAKWRKDWRTD